MFCLVKGASQLRLDGLHEQTCLPGYFLLGHTLPPQRLGEHDHHRSPEHVCSLSVKPAERFSATPDIHCTPVGRELKNGHAVSVIGRRIARNYGQTGLSSFTKGEPAHDYDLPAPREKPDLPRHLSQDDLEGLLENVGKARAEAALPRAEPDVSRRSRPDFRSDYGGRRVPPQAFGSCQCG